MSFDGEMLFQTLEFELVLNGGDRFNLTRLSDDGDRLMSVFFTSTNELEAGDVELLLDEEVVGMVRSRAPIGLLDELSG